MNLPKLSELLKATAAVIDELTESRRPAPLTTTTPARRKRRYHKRRVSTAAPKAPIHWTQTPKGRKTMRANAKRRQRLARTARAARAALAAARAEGSQE